MPQRFLRPGITTSDNWNGCSWEAQSFYIRILTLVDDFGRFDGRIAILHGQCFALRQDIKPQRTAALRSELQHHGLIEVYVVDGKEYIQVSRWKERTRGPSHYPDPSKSIRSDPQRSAADGSDPLPPESEPESKSEPLPFVGVQAPRFQKPSESECMELANERGMPPTEGTRFFGYYESNGWRVGKNPMKSWQAAMTTWKSNWQERNGHGLKPQTKSFQP